MAIFFDSENIKSYRYRSHLTLPMSDLGLAAHSFLFPLNSGDTQVTAQVILILCLFSVYLFVKISGFNKTLEKVGAWPKTKNR